MNEIRKTHFGLQPLAAIVIAVSVLWHFSFLLTLRAGHGVVGSLPLSWCQAFVCFPPVCLVFMLMLAFEYLHQGRMQTGLFYTALGTGLSSWITWWLSQCF
jgi:hypothetical protein